MKTKITKALRVFNYFLAHPNAIPKDVGERFSMAMPTVYSLRAKARAASTTVPAQQEVKAESVPVTTVRAVTMHASGRQVGGDHYKSLGVEPWTVVDTWPAEQQIGYYRGNALKYIMRLGTKDELPVDAAKGQHYTQKLVEVLNAQSKLG
jgi:hypothetical protein